MKQRRYDGGFVGEMKARVDVELIGAVSIEASGSEELKERTSALLPGAKSVVVPGKETYKEVIDLLQPAKEVGEALPGDLLGPHVDYLYGRLNRAVHELAALFRREGYRSLPMPAAAPTDFRFMRGLFSYKHAAVLAGMGTLGRHSLLITPEIGPRARLACVLTEAPVESTASNAGEDHCINCDACIRECPAGALQVPKPGEPYSMNRFACRTYRQAGLACSVCVKACDQVIG